MRGAGNAAANTFAVFGLDAQKQTGGGVNRMGVCGPNEKAAFVDFQSTDHQREQLFLHPPQSGLHVIGAHRQCGAAVGVEFELPAPAKKEGLNDHHREPRRPKHRA